MRAQETDHVLPLIRFMTGCMGLLVAMFAYVLLKPEPGEATPTPPGQPRCDLSRPGGDSCTDGTFCLNGVCQPLPEEEQRCQLGEGCLDCRCAEDLVCHQARCRDPREAIPPADCRDPAVADSVAQLKRDCDDRKVSLTDLRENGCTSNQWEQISLKNPEQFGTILSAFKNRFTVHFPPGEPSRRRSGFTNEHYLAQLAKLRGPLAGAKQIFVIGRASPDGNADDNYQLALRRMDMVSDLIGQVVHGGAKRTERGLLSIRQWSLRNEDRNGDGKVEAMTASVFRQNYLSPSLRDAFGVPSTIAADAATEDRMTDLLARRDKLSPADERWLIGALNRVVIVVPIPCDGTELFPVKPVAPNPMLPASALEVAR